MGFNNAIRKMKGSVKINFLSNKMEKDVALTDTSRTDKVFDSHIKNLFESDFVPDAKKLILLKEDSQDLPPDELCYLSDTSEITEPEITEKEKCYLLGADSSVGWYGQERADDDRVLKNTYLKITFKYPCEILYMTIKGDRGEYPENISLTFNTEQGQTAPVEYNFQSEGPESEGIKFAVNSMPAKEVIVKINKWSKAHAVAKIAHLSCEMIVDYQGAQIKSIDILEEKTGSADKLSYGISSNYCKIEVLNENQKYLEPKYYNTLRKNLSVQPAIECGGGHTRSAHFTARNGRSKAGILLLRVKPTTHYTA